MLLSLHLEDRVTWAVLSLWQPCSEENVLAFLICVTGSGWLFLIYCYSYLASWMENTAKHLYKPDGDWWPLSRRVLGNEHKHKAVRPSGTAVAGTGMLWRPLYFMSCELQRCMTLWVFCRQNEEPLLSHLSASSHFL